VLEAEARALFMNTQTRTLQCVTPETGLELHARRRLGKAKKDNPSWLSEARERVGNGVLFLRVVDLGLTFTLCVDAAIHGEVTEMTIKHLRDSDKHVLHSSPKVLDLLGMQVCKDKVVPNLYRIKVGILQETLVLVKPKCALRYCVMKLHLRKKKFLPLSHMEVSLNLLSESHISVVYTDSTKETHAIKRESAKKIWGGLP